MIRQWKRSQIQVFAPDLWYAEVTSAIRQMLFRKSITPDEGCKAIYDLFALEIQIERSDVDLCLSAARWAEQLGQLRAYASFYIALAEKLGSELWTADERLANRSYQIGAPWVCWVGEAS